MYIVKDTYGHIVAFCSRHVDAIALASTKLDTYRYTIEKTSTPENRLNYLNIATGKKVFQV